MVHLAAASYDYVLRRGANLRTDGTDPRRDDRGACSRGLAPMVPPEVTRSARRRLWHTVSVLAPRAAAATGPAGLASTPTSSGSTPPPPTAGIEHPTAAERFRFGNEGMLVLPDLLPRKMVDRLVRAVHETAQRRHAPGYTWPGRRPLLGGGGDTLGPGGNLRVSNFLHEDPVFLELMTYPPALAYVRGLFNSNAKYGGSGCFVETEPADWHSTASWHTDAGQSSKLTALFQPHVPFLYIKLGFMSRGRHCRSAAPPSDCGRC